MRNDLLCVLQRPVNLALNHLHLIWLNKRTWNDAPAWSSGRSRTRLVRIYLEFSLHMERIKPVLRTYQDLYGPLHRSPAVSSPSRVEKFISQLKLTSKVPQFILEDAITRGEGAECCIAVTQPRRISAITLAERVANERGEQLGTSVGYKIRLDSRPARTNGSITFVTTGIVLRWLS